MELWLKLCWIFLTICSARTLDSAWSWKCIKGYCERAEITAETEETALSMAGCWLTCSDYASLWPKPTGNFSKGNSSSLEVLNVIKIKVVGYEKYSASGNLFKFAEKMFKSDLFALANRNTDFRSGKSLTISLSITDSHASWLTLDTDESYTLTVTDSETNALEAYITADNFFGARNGLTTLSQLIALDDLRNQIIILKDVFISDAPAYPIRGVMLDTARNYIDVDTIKRTLKGMGASKLNTFHWHLTDSTSWSYVSKTYPELSHYGAYSPRQVYTDNMIRDIIQYARVQGIRVIPEIDSPAHVGQGWQHTGLVTCLNWQPWYYYCVEPPCGQFDPTKDELYDVLEGLFGDVIEQFRPEILHIGGDEVKDNCWNSTASIVEWMLNNGYDLSEEGFIKLRMYFQNNTVERIYNQVETKMPLITWQSSLTDDYSSYLSTDQFIVHIWSAASTATALLEDGFKVILSNYDAMYLDCGFASWYWLGNNWCSPYKNWNVMYNNTPTNVAGVRKSQVLGNIAALWTETADSASVDTKVWPRAAAAAESVWSDPTTSWTKAEHRFLVHRERLIQKGIKADSVQPTWCVQNEENCRYLSYFFSYGGRTN